MSQLLQTENERMHTLAGSVVWDTGPLSGIFLFGKLPVHPEQRNIAFHFLYGRLRRSRHHLRKSDRKPWVALCGLGITQALRFIAIQYPHPSFYFDLMKLLRLLTLPYVIGCMIDINILCQKVSGSGIAGV